MKTPFLILAAMVLLLHLCACTSGRSAVPASALASIADTIPTVPVAKVARATLSGDLAVTAEFEPYQEVDVMAKVAGYVHSITVDIGDRVRGGQVLATLDVPEMEDELTKAGASVEQASAEVTMASDELSRANSAHDLAHLSFTRIQNVAQREPGLVPQQQVDEFRSRDLVGEAQVAAAKSRLLAAQKRERVEQAEVGRLKTLRSYTTITAPFSGVITKRYANPGAMIQAGTASQSQVMPLVRLSQNDLLRLILPIPESSAPKVRPGQAVDVNVPSLQKTIPGRIARIAGKLQLASRTMDTEVDVPNPNLMLLPGMYAQVSLRLEEHVDALAIPLDAVERSGNSTNVYRVDSSGVLHVAPVVLGLETAQRLEVRSGLQDGDLVVVGRHAGLKDGDKVQPKLSQ
jgi:RND family efflux transporter MFP subunit